MVQARKTCLQLGIGESFGESNLPGLVLVIVPYLKPLTNVGVDLGAWCIVAHEYYMVCHQLLLHCLAIRRTKCMRHVQRWLCFLP